MTRPREARKGDREIWAVEVDMGEGRWVAMLNLVYMELGFAESAARRETERMRIPHRAVLYVPAPYPRKRSRSHEEEAVRLLRIGGGWPVVSCRPLPSSSRSSSVTVASSSSRRLEQHAPAAPWKACGCGLCGLVWCRASDATVADAVQQNRPTDDEGKAIVCAAQRDFGMGGYTQEKMAENAEYIAAIRNAAPALISAARRWAKAEAFLQAYGNAICFNGDDCMEHAAVEQAHEELRNLIDEARR